MNFKINLLSFLTLLCALFSLNAHAFSTQLAEAGDGTVIWGDIIMQASWNDTTKYKVVSFPASSNPTFTTLFSEDATYRSVGANGGGAFVNNVFHLIHYETGFGTVATHYAYDADDWSPIGYGKDVDLTLIAYTTAYDETTGNVYGEFVDLKGGHDFGIINYDNLTRSTITKFSTTIMCMVAAEGNLYGIGADGVLYNINKSTGELTKIGSTGVDLSNDYIESAAYSKKNGKIYWATTTKSNVSGIYEIDKNTGKATLIGTFPEMTQITALYVPYAPEAGAPAKATGIQMIFDTYKVNGKINFTAPSKTVGGDALSGTLNYKITANGAVIATGTCSAGEKVSVPVTVKAGDNKIVVTTSNSVGESPRAWSSNYIGMGVPSSVRSLSVSVSGSTASLSWSEPFDVSYPSTFYPNEYFNEDSLFYDITRYPDSVAVARGIKGHSFKDNLEGLPINAYSYGITPYLGKSQHVEGKETKSKTFSYGDAYQVPYFEDFTNQEHASLYTLVDKNKDGKTWKWSKVYNRTAGRLRYEGNDSRNADDWAITPNIHLLANKEYTLSFRTAILTSRYPMKLEVAYGKGVDPTLFSTIMPEFTVASITDDDEGNSGETYKVKVKVSQEGNYNFGFHAVSDANQGYLYLDDIRVTSPDDADLPQAPKNVSLVDNNDGTADLSWSSPGTVGANGGIVDESKLTYNIYDKSNTIVSNGQSQTFYAVSGISQVGAQDTVRYYVSAVSPQGTGEKARSQIILSGKPYELPFKESWPNLKAQDNHLWWSEGPSSTPFQPTNESYNGMTFDHDGGSMFWYPLKDNDATWLNSGKINIKGANEPRLDFAYLAVPDSAVAITVFINQGETDIPVDTVDYKTLSGSIGFAKESVSLKKFQSSGDYVIVKFRASGSSKTTPVLIDAIEVNDVKDNDLKIENVSYAQTVKVGKQQLITVQVSNAGLKTASDYSVVLNDKNGNTLASQNGNAIDAGRLLSYQFSLVPEVIDGKQADYTVSVDYAADENLTNNSKSIHFAIQQPTYPTVDDLSATSNGNNAVLSWTAPKDTAARTITDSFEDYSPWMTNDFGDWITYDQDKGQTYTVTRIDYPHKGEPIAFMVMPDTLGLLLDENTVLTGHTGKQFLIAIASDPETTSLQRNDDWLVSPLLSGNAQFISFWTMPLLTDYGAETYEVLYSTTGNAVADFKNTAASLSNNKVAWKQETVSLPSGAKYFAIRYTSKDVFSIVLDDVTYEAAALSIDHYNIYRDGVLIGTVEPGETTFTDGNAGSGNHTYNVSVVYTVGESAVSNDANVNVTTLINSITANSLNGSEVTVYTVNGAVVAKGMNVVNGLPKGVYIIKDNTNNTTHKLIKK